MLVTGERRKRTTEAKATQFLSLLLALPIEQDVRSCSQCWSDAVPLARRFELTVYDAAYLELALRLGLPIASLDERLLAAATVAGVERFRPPPADA